MTPQQLKELLASATPRPWSQKSFNAFGYSGQHILSTHDTIARLPFDFGDDADAIVATMNRAELLAELWEAAKEIALAYPDDYHPSYGDAPTGVHDLREVLTKLQGAAE